MCMQVSAIVKVKLWLYSAGCTHSKLLFQAMCHVCSEAATIGALVLYYNIRQFCLQHKLDNFLQHHCLGIFNFVLDC